MDTEAEEADILSGETDLEADIMSINNVLPLVFFLFSRAPRR